MSGLSRPAPFSRVVSPRAPHRALRAAACAACALGVAVLAGCSLVPAYQRPGAPLAQRFDGAANASLADTVPVKSGWWREYHDPALDALVDRSLQNNFTLASAIASVEQARGNAEKAGAPQYPSLTLGATFDRAHQGRGSTTKTQSLFAEASYEVDFWGFNAANASAADLLARASEFDRDTVALTLTASVADTYFQVQSLRRRLAIARSISDDAAHILQLLLAQQEAGVATELQVQQQRNALARYIWGRWFICCRCTTRSGWSVKSACSTTSATGASKSASAAGCRRSNSPITESHSWIRARFSTKRSM